MTTPTDVLRLGRSLAMDEVARARLALRFLAQTGIVDDLALGGLVALLRGRGRITPSMTVRFHAANSPHRAAVIDADRGRTISFAELDRSIDKAVHVLTSLGVRRGESVLIMIKNSTELLVLQMALSRLGGAAVAVSWRSTATELGYLLENSGARALFFSAEHADVVRAATRASRHRIGANAVAVGGKAAGFVGFEELLEVASPAASFESESGEASVVIYTSGTTGKPKGAVRKFDRRSMLPVLGFLTETPLRVGQRHLVVCPLYHATAFAFVGLSFVLGNTVVLLDFEPGAFLDALERHRIHHAAVVPTQLYRTLELGDAAVRSRDTSSLVALFSGGAPLDGTLAARVMDAFGDKLFNFYGATETGLVTLARPHDLRVAPGTIGRVLDGNHVRLLDDEGRDVPEGEVGELFVKSGNLVAGYHANDAATAEATREGYFSVGDLARRDARGLLFIEGRKRDLIISGGVNVYPREIEAALSELPEVGDVAVVGIPDPEWGERVHAFVEPRTGAVIDLAALRDHCRERLAGPKRPRGFTILESLPRNPTGKILKRELRRRLLEGVQPS
ncbi:MAG: AMP-binding protein [Deltaproteobacteria bacterium]|nr:AMP-binding protein [Deltaproteobacteria bacterium]